MIDIFFFLTCGIRTYFDNQINSLDMDIDICLPMKEKMILVYEENINLLKYYY